MTYSDAMDRVDSNAVNRNEPQAVTDPHHSFLITLILLAALTLFLRSLGAPWVFISGDVMLDPWDGAYHVRRAFYSFVNFPDILYFDSYMRFPDGAPIPFPPLYDWCVAAVARLFGDSEATFARVAAWVGPVLATLTVLPVYALGRRVSNARVGLVAAGLFAVFPASAMNSAVGDLDHHGAVAFLLALLIASGAALLEARPDQHLQRSLLLAVVRAALILVWTGSMLYVVVGEAVLLIGGLLVNRKELCAAQALGLVATSAMVAPWIHAAGPPIGGSFSSTEMSWLHVVVLTLAAGVWAGLWVWERHREAPVIADQFKRAALFVGAGTGGALVIPSLREAIAPGLAFVAKADTWAPVNAEQAPLFPWMHSGPIAGSDLSLTMFGVFSYAIPLLPFVLAWPWLRSTRRPLHFALFGWAAVLSALALMQVRFCNDLAPLASVGFALGIDRARGALGEKLGHVLASVVALVVGLILIWPAMQFHTARMPLFIAYASGERPNFDASLFNGDTALVRFAELIREVTPETSGYLDGESLPEYAVMSLPSHGHVIHSAARRPTPANNFGPYLDAKKVEITNAAYASKRESEVVALLDSLRARYWMTSDAFWLTRETFVHSLHRGDGSQSALHEGAEHFRLVVESVPGSRPTFAAFPGGAPDGTTPYKLWERVEGALLRCEANPGEWVRIEIDVMTNTGRRFRYQASRRADASGVALLRVPYSTRAGSETHTVTPYRVASNSKLARVHVDESQVRRGATIHVQVR